MSLKCPTNTRSGPGEFIPQSFAVLSLPPDAK